MPRVIDLPNLRNRRRVFRDRYHAGQVLAELIAMEADRWPRPLLLAIPAGGVPVAVALHERLGWPLELAVVSKITPSWNPEMGYGALAWDGTLMLNEALVEHLGLSPAEVEADIRRTREKVARRLQVLRGARPLPDLSQHSVFLVDDGLATGATMQVAIRVARNAGAGRLALAVPTAHQTALWHLARQVETVYCPNIREETPYAVAEAYQTWTDLDDQALLDWLARAGRVASSPNP